MAFFGSLDQETPSKAANSVLVKVQEEVLALLWGAPEAPDLGDRYAILEEVQPGDAWEGHENDIAEWNGTNWDFYDTAPGMNIYATGEDELYILMDDGGIYWDYFRNYIGITPGVSDHGALTGLNDDDHLQYFRTNGSRAMTGIFYTEANYPAIIGKANAGLNLQASPANEGGEVLVLYGPRPSITGLEWIDIATPFLNFYEARLAGVKTVEGGLNNNLTMKPAYTRDCTIEHGFNINQHFFLPKISMQLRKVTTAEETAMVATGTGPYRVQVWTTAEQGMIWWNSDLGKVSVWDGTGIKRLTFDP